MQLTFTNRIYMKSLLVSSLLLFLPLLAFSQIKTVDYNPSNNELNGNMPIPSEEVFFIRGVLPRDIQAVTVTVFRNGKNPVNSEVYQWKKAFDFSVSQFELFVSNPLRSNDRYDLEFKFYQTAGVDQMNQIKNTLNGNLEAYIRANLEVSSSGIKSRHSNQVMMSQMEQIVVDGLKNYMHFLGQEFPGFSDVARLKLEQKDRLKMKKARFNIIGKNSTDDDKAVYANQFINELVDLIQNESNQYLDRSLLAVVDIRRVTNYPTEKKPGTLPLNFGYGTIPVKRFLPSTEYLHGMYVGLSLPMGNKTFSKFLGNASFSTGVFIQNFESSRGDQIDGQFIGLPIYAGLGYKMFRVFRLNFGAVALTMQEGNAGQNLNVIQPFAGVSLEFNIWLGINNKR